MRLEPRSKPPTTRRQLASRKKLKTHRKRSLHVALVGGAILAIGGLVAGGSLAVSSGDALHERVAATTALAESTGLEREQLAVYDGIAKVHTHNTATIVLGEARRLIAATSKKKVDASALTAVTVSLSGYKTLPLTETAQLTAQAKTEIVSVTEAAVVADRAAAEVAAAKAATAQKAADQVAAAKAAVAKKAAAKAAVAKEAADAAAAAREAVARAAAAKAQVNRTASLAGSNSPAGARASASGMASSRYGWGSAQFSCLNQLWMKESGWNYRAYNASSGATGIPQALPGSKMASAGSDWASNASTQIAWGLDYIKSRYGSPCAAWSHSQAVNWY